MKREGCGGEKCSSSECGVDVVAITKKPIFDGGLVHTGVVMVKLCDFIRLEQTQRTLSFVRCLVRVLPSRGG